jgi:hypothetical protein
VSDLTDEQLNGVCLTPLRVPCDSSITTLGKTGSIGFQLTCKKIQANKLKPDVEDMIATRDMS